MSNFRVIVALQISDGQLVKSKKFCHAVYLGDVLNALYTFSNWVADEICVLDVSSNRKRIGPDFDLVGKLAKYIEVPMSYGGGISSYDDAIRLIDMGCDRIIFNSLIFENPHIVEKVSETIGSQSVVASIDYINSPDSKIKSLRPDRKIFLNYKEILDHIRICMNIGVGEVMLTCADRDGTRAGLDLSIAEYLTSNIDIPIIISGGAKSMENIEMAKRISGVSAVAVGTLFSFYKDEKSVLLSYQNFWE